MSLPWCSILTLLSVPHQLMRPGSWLSYQSGYDQHARLGTWQNLCSLCWLPGSLVGKTWAISHKKKKIILGGNSILIFWVGHEKLFPMQWKMNLEREWTHKQLNVWTPTGEWPDLKFCKYKYLLLEFSVCNKLGPHIIKIIRLRHPNQCSAVKVLAYWSTKNTIKNCAAACKCQSLATKADLEKY